MLDAAGVDIAADAGTVGDDGSGCSVSMSPKLHTSAIAAIGPSLYSLDFLIRSCSEVFGPLCRITP